MMKKVTQGVMIIVILLGFVLALTPIIGSIIFKDDASSTIRGKEGAIQSALAEWFDAPKTLFVDAKGIRQIRKDRVIARFSFSTPPDVVRAFITKRQLKQKELTASAMQKVFIDTTIPWWKPDALQRKTWFTGHHKKKILSLIYNEKTQRAVLVIQ
ncbi:MAG: hypothetical protein KAH22_00890 [Thiotrichaceae bacterium]|nr:hypothetical protein [Thiotrichaceae bacterium]